MVMLRSPVVDLSWSYAGGVLLRYATLLWSHSGYGMSLHYCEYESVTGMFGCSKRMLDSIVWETVTDMVCDGNLTAGSRLEYGFGKVTDWIY
jgi:hypothetical protein